MVILPEPEARGLGGDDERDDVGRATAVEIASAKEDGEREEARREACREYRDRGEERQPRGDGQRREGREGRERGVVGRPAADEEAPQDREREPERVGLLPSAEAASAEADEATVRAASCPRATRRAPKSPRHHRDGARHEERRENPLRDEAPPREAHRERHQNGVSRALAEPEVAVQHLALRDEPRRHRVEALVGVPRGPRNAPREARDERRERRDDGSARDRRRLSAPHR